MAGRSPHFHCCAVLVAAGSGTRMGFDKLLAPLGGTNVLQRSFDTLLAHPSIHSLVVVCPAERWQPLARPGGGKPVAHTPGGALRQDSVLSGIRQCPPEATHLAIHDAARPLVSGDDIRRVIEAARSMGAASLAHRVVDTLKRTDATDHIRESVPRDNLWGMETPQVFSRSLLEESFATPQAGEFTDEVSRLQALGHPIVLVESRQPNPKITTPADLHLAHALLAAAPRPTP